MDGRELEEAEDEADGCPDHEEGCQDPEQEGRLPDREPRDLGAVEEETRAAEATAVRAVFGDLARDRASGILRRVPVCVVVRRLPPVGVFGAIAVPHPTSVALVGRRSEKAVALLPREGRER
jgi:hypothetical protein